MATKIQPAMGPLQMLAEWVERHETVLAGALLVNADGDGHGNHLCLLLLSRDDSGEYLLRLCEGYDDRWMTWREQRRLRPIFGSAYVEALWGSQLQRRLGQGWTLEWNAKRSADGVAELRPGLLALAA